MHQGTVTSFSSSGFGLIAPDRGGNELWVRLRHIVCEPPRQLREGERVEFEIGYGLVGVEAVNVRPADTNSSGDGAGTAADLRCARCGYGITDRAPLPACPMCSSRQWLLSSRYEPTPERRRQ